LLGIDSRRGQFDFAPGLGADTWATEVIPNKEPGCAFCVHSHLLTRNGIVNQENIDLDALAADKAYRFMYVYSPVPIAGATGSIGAPLAIRCDAPGVEVA
jgi:kynurenine formamidase